MRRSTPERLANVCMQIIAPTNPHDLSYNIQLHETQQKQLGGFFSGYFITAILRIAQCSGHCSHLQMEYYSDTGAFSTANLVKVTAVCSDGARLPTLQDLRRAQSWICTRIFSSFRKQQSAVTRSVRGEGGRSAEEPNNREICM